MITVVADVAPTVIDATGDRPIILDAGNSTVEAGRQAAIATAASASAAADATRAEDAANVADGARRYFSTVAAGTSGTTAPDTFVSDESGVLTWYDAGGNPIGEPATRIDVASRTALKAFPAAAWKRAYLTESGRAGNFLYDASVPIATHQADTLEGIYIAPNAAADGAWVRQFSGPVFIEWWGAVANTNPDSLTGLETDNAAAIKAAVATGRVIRCQSSAPTAAFGFKSQITIDRRDGVFGNTLSPNGLCLVALPDYTRAGGVAEPVVKITDERGSVDGLRVVIPTALWDPATSTGTEVNGVATTAGKYKARVYNCDVIGGEIAFQAAGLEGDFHNCRAKTAKVGFDVTGYDNEFSSCCESVENDIGFRSNAGAEGEIHCVRNRVGAELTGSIPFKIFIYDDTSYETGIHCKSLRHTTINTAHTKLGLNRVDPATEPARYFLMEDSYNIRFISHGVDQGAGSQTNIAFIDIADSGGAAAAGIASVRNVWEGYRIATAPVGRDDTQRGLIARNRFERCSGPFIGRYNANGGELIGEGVALAAGGTRNFTVYLPRNPGTQANTTITVEGRLIMRSGTNKRCVKRVFVSMTNNASGETLNEATLTELYKSTGNTDTYNETITGISYSATPNSFTYTFTGPSAVSCTCEFVWDKFLVNQGAF